MVTPPVHAIEALDRVERLGSVAAAAASLAVTPSAVSHRLRTLDAALGFPTVTPSGRGLTLTSRARRFLDAARPGLTALAGAARTARGEGAPGPLRLSAPPGFASAWLCTRLDEARAALPGVEITLTTDQPETADAAILFLSDDAAAGAAPLVRPRFFPVCAPSLAHRAGGLRRPADLAGETRLHLFDRTEWRDWAVTARAGDHHGAEVVFGDANLLIAAALAGQGVMLGDAITCGRALDEGALIRPFATEIESARAYVLNLNDGAPPAAALFADWLRRALGA